MSAPNKPEVYRAQFQSCDAFRQSRGSSQYKKHVSCDVLTVKIDTRAGEEGERSPQQTVIHEMQWEVATEQRDPLEKTLSYNRVYLS